VKEKKYKTRPAKYALFKGLVAEKKYGSTMGFVLQAIQCGVEKISKKLQSH